MTADHHPLAGPRVISVNVGAVREVEWQGRTVTSAIWKQPIAGRVALRGVNLAGDDQADRSVHGGPDKAVYAYAVEDYAFWRDEHGMETPVGLFGENLTVAGLDLSAAVVGERWSVGSTVLEVAQPRLPCFKLGMRVGDAHFLKRFFAADRMGAYFRVIQEGDVGAGDSIEVMSAPSHGVTLRMMTAVVRDRGQAAVLRRIPRLPDWWQDMADAG